MTIRLRVLPAFIALAGTLPLGLAQAADFETIHGTLPSAYLLDSQGNIVRNSTGLCWHDGYYTDANAKKGCDLPDTPAAPPPAPATPVPPPPPPVVPAPPPPPPPPPAPPPAPKPAVVKKSVQHKITFQSDEFFEFDKATLKPAATAALDNLVSELKSATKLDGIQITGHTDSKGTEAYNLKLSVKRAEAVKTYLAAHNINPAIMHTVGKGKSQPIADNATDAGRAKNRRVDVEVDGYKLVTETSQ